MPRGDGRGGARDGAGRPLSALEQRKPRSGKVPVWLGPHAILQLIELQSARGWGGDQLVETLIAEAHAAEFGQQKEEG